MLDINRKHERDEEEKSEAVLRNSDLFKKEVAEKAKTLRLKDLYFYLYIDIVKYKGEIGQTIIQDDHKERQYNEFIENMAVLYKLEQLGCIKKENQLDNGEYVYSFLETDLDKLRKIIFAGTWQECEEIHDYLFDQKILSYENGEITLPFRRY